MLSLESVRTGRHIEGRATISFDDRPTSLYTFFGVSGHTFYRCIPFSDRVQPHRIRRLSLATIDYKSSSGADEMG